MKVKINIINAFIDGTKGGNPAGVVLNADELNQDQRLLIAKEVGLSETAFVSNSTVADFKLDFYTPTRQIAHCGHATIAVFSYLEQLGVIKEGWLSKETIDGNRKILIKDGMAYMEQLKPKFIGVETYHTKIYDSIGITGEQLISPPEVVNTGNRFLILAVENQQVLAGLKPKTKLIESLSEQLDLIGYYIFTTETIKADRDATTRMLAPMYGIDEEAGTGMAAGPLACYLYYKMGIKKEQFNIEQGYLMQPPSPSVIQVNLEIHEDDIISLMAGGIGKITHEMTLDI